MTKPIGTLRNYVKALKKKFYVSIVLCVFYLPFRLLNCLFDLK